MKKLNNKGLTIIEILLCFVLVVTITVGLFSMLNAYKNKEQLTSDKNEISPDKAISLYLTFPFL